MSAIAFSSETEWRELRSRHVGGSEVAALFGEHPHLTKFELWHRKKGTLPEPDLSDNERVFWGQTLEPAIAMGVAKLQKWNVRKVRPYFTHPKVDGFGGSLDYEVADHAAGPGVLEIKTADWLVVRNWQNGEPPLSYELQVQSYLSITGRAWGAMAVLVGGNELRLFRYERRPKTVEIIEAAVAEFWQSIRDNAEPKPNFAEDGEAIARLYGVAVAGKSVNMSADNRLQALVAAYKESAATEKEAKQQRDAAKAEILTKIGDAAAVVCGAFKISAGVVGPASISYERSAYRDFRVHERKGAAP